MKRYLPLAAVPLLILGAAACEDEALSDAPVGIVDDSSVFVITNADQFPNLSLKCYEGALIITTTRDYDALEIIPEFAPCLDGDPVPGGE